MDLLWRKVHKVTKVLLSLASQLGLLFFDTESNRRIDHMVRQFHMRAHPLIEYELQRFAHESAEAGVTPDTPSYWTTDWVPPAPPEDLPDDIQADLPQESDDTGKTDTAASKEREASSRSGRDYGDLGEDDIQPFKIYVTQEFREWALDTESSLLPYIDTALFLLDLIPTFFVCNIVSMSGYS